MNLYSKSQSGESLYAFALPAAHRCCASLLCVKARQMSRLRTALKFVATAVDAGSHGSRGAVRIRMIAA